MTTSSLCVVLRTFCRVFFELSPAGARYNAADLQCGCDGAARISARRLSIYNVGRFWTQRIILRSAFMAGSNEVVIIAGCRTPVGKFQGSLSDLSATQLGAIAVREAVKRANIDPRQIDECIMGNVVSAGLGQNPARQAAIFGGLPPEVGAMTVNKVCGSGLKAVALAAQAIQTGNSSVVVAGGMESMTNAPYLLPQARKGYRLGNGQLVDSMVNDGLWDIYNNYHMGITGENVAEKYGITREEQDQFAVNSHRKAIAAIKECRFKSQIVPVEIPAKKKGQPPVIFDQDEGPREDTTIEVLRSLKPAFKKDGTVTAGNAPGVNDGALPAVTVPSFLKAGLRARSASMVVSSRGPSSWSKITGGWPFFLAGISTPTICDLNRHSFCAALALRCELTANSSCSSRVMPYFSATFSPVSPM